MKNYIIEKTTQPGTPGIVLLRLVPECAAKLDQFSLSAREKFDHCLGGNQATWIGKLLISQG